MSQPNIGGMGGGGGGAAPPRPLQMGAKGAYIVRLLMVGDSSCGKTSLVLRFDQNVFSTKFVTTIGVDYRDKMVKVSLLVMMYEYALPLEHRFVVVLRAFRRAAGADPSFFANKL